MTTAYKVLGEKGQAHHGGKGSWPLANGRPGKWVEVRLAVVSPPTGAERQK